MPLLRRAWAAWRRLAHRIAVVNGVVVLALFYLLIITPYALVLRLLGRDLLDRRWDPAAPTYWRARPARAPGRERYLRPF